LASEELVEMLVDELMDSFAKAGKKPNYVFLKNLIQRFIKNNPDADPTKVDWVGVWDSSLTDFDEIINVFEKAYPMYRWGSEQGLSEERWRSEVKSMILQQMQELSPDDIEEIIEKARELAGLAGPEEKPKTIAKAEEVQVVKTAPKAIPTKPVINLATLAKYPFLREARDFASAFNIADIPDTVIIRAIERVREAVERGERGVSVKVDNPFTEFMSIPTAKMILRIVDNRWLQQRWALAEAARVEKLLYLEDSEMFNMILQRLGLKIVEENGSYKIHFTDYLRIIEKRLRYEKAWKLVNRELSEGLVKLTKAEVCRLAREVVYDIFSKFDDLPRPREDKIPEKVREAVNEVKQLALKHAASFSLPAIRREEWPPCMRAIMNSISEATHFMSFALAAFMSQRGYDINEIVDVFRQRSDFDERIARYQIEHIAGKRGGGTKYKPPSCRTMQTHGLCIEEGKLCGGIKNPLQYRQPPKNHHHTQPHPPPEQ